MRQGKSGDSPHRIRRNRNMIYDNNGQRKYLTSTERDRFIQAAIQMPLDEQSFCLAIAYSGCRISEALQLTSNRVDLVEQVLIIRTLKRRNSGIYRGVPMPEWVLRKIQNQLNLSDAYPQRRIWSWSRGKGWMVIKRAMANARVVGQHASPKGLRHGFGIAAIQNGIPLNLVQKWLGHSKIETTAIYANAMGDEEREIAKRMWARRTQVQSRQ